jgi:hypothetical protein
MKPPTPSRAALTTARGEEKDKAAKLRRRGPAHRMRHILAEVRAWHRARALGHRFRRESGAGLPRKGGAGGIAMTVKLRDHIPHRVRPHTHALLPVSWPAEVPAGANQMNNPNALKKQASE